jgi:hypothetical protein
MPLAAPVTRTVRGVAMGRSYAPRHTEGAQAWRERCSDSVPPVIVASIYGTGFIVLGSLLALWSLWWIVKAALADPIERNAEDEARAAVGRGEGWPDERGPGRARKSFSDEEIARLSAALEPADPAEVGVEVREKTDREKRRDNGR